MKEKVLKLLNEYFDTEFSYVANTICDPSNRPIFHYSPEKNEIKFIGRWPRDRKREKWNYIYGLYIALRNEPIQVHNGQLQPFTGASGKKEKINEATLLRVAEEYDQYLKFLDDNYVYNLVENGNKAYIITNDLSFRIHLRTTEENWLLGITNGTMKTRRVAHGRLIAEVARIIEEHIDIQVLRHTFDTAPTFLIKYPYLSAYFEKRLRLPTREAEAFAREIEKHTGISAYDLEYELSASRKKQRLQSIHIQPSTIGGDNVHYYEYPSTISSGEKRKMYFKQTNKECFRYDANNL
ncbi:hypothetical protein [Bacillus toyonensis]|uniref:hypothetical protein n=1 Tax=Bacillus toyonensis TaxID=155322 RepID=UPI002E250BB7|nr:hypothetical protein [Bacillus toyonensis]